MNDKLREELADLCHKQWSGWMKYLFSKCQETGDGRIIIPSWAVLRWQKQMTTAYKDLPEEEKESDKEEADRFIKILTSPRCLKLLEPLFKQRKDNE